MAVLLGAGGLVARTLAPPNGVRDATRLKRVLPMRENELGAYALATVLSVVEWRDIRAAGVAMEAYWPNEVTVTAGDVRLRVHEAQVSDGFLGMVGAELAAGRYPAQEEETAVLLSGRAARALFSTARQAIGAVVRLDGEVRTVVGVLGGGFSGLDGGPTDVWRPLSQATTRDAVVEYGLSGVVRVRDQGAAGVIGARVATVLTARGVRVRSVALAALSSDRLGGLGLARRTLPFVLLLSGALILLAAANCWLLVVAWALVRSADLRTRHMLGAPPWRLVSNLSGVPVMVLLAATAAALVAQPTIDGFLPSLRPGDGFAAEVAWMDAALCGIAALAGAAAVIIFAARRAKSAARCPRVEWASATGRALVVGTYVGAVSALGVAAAPIFAANAALSRLKPGFDADHLVLVTVSQGTASALRLEQITEALARIKRRSSVASVAASSAAPFRAVSTGIVSPSATGDRGVPAYLYHVLGNAVDVLDLKALAVDSIAGGALANSVVVSQELAKRWQLRVGGCVYLEGAICLPARAIVPDIAAMALGEPAFPTVFAPMRRAPLSGRVHLMVRLKTHPTPVDVDGVEADAAAAFPAMAVRAERMRDVVREQTAPLRAGQAMCAVLLAVGVVLGVVGLRASTQVSVAVRRRELGVRAALGATPERLVMTIVRESAVSAGAALALGLAVGLMGSHALGSVVVGAGSVASAAQVGLATLAPALLVITAAASGARAAMREPAINLRHVE